MPDVTQSDGPTLVPYFSYGDASAAIEWLVRAFGFEIRQRYDDPQGGVVHAELALGGGVIMLGTGDPPPRGSGGTSPNGHGVYAVVANVDAHHARAVDAGATIVYPPEDTDFGTRRYRALDTEGYEWSFGSYRPTAHS